MTGLKLANPLCEARSKGKVDKKQKQKVTLVPHSWRIYYAGVNKITGTPHGGMHLLLQKEPTSVKGHHTWLSLRLHQS